MLVLVSKVCKVCWLVCKVCWLVCKVCWLVCKVQGVLVGLQGAQGVLVGLQGVLVLSALKACISLQCKDVLILNTMQGYIYV